MAAQAQLIEERAGCRPVLLVDDLAAELDAEGRCLAASLLLSGPGQVFLTATDPEVLRTPLAGHEPALFHVERGVIDAGSTSR